MERFIRILFAALVMLALCAPIAYATSGTSDDHTAGSDRPKVTARSATSVSDHSAILRATIDPSGDDDSDDRLLPHLLPGGSGGNTTYHFQFGPTTGYGFTSPSGTLADGGKTNVSVQVNGLTPATIYRFRAVASNAAGTTYGSSGTFKTFSSSGGKGPQPALGRTVVAKAAAGTVLIREQGSSEFHPLESAEAIPVNSTVDTRQGTVALVTARGDGVTQTGTFRGGLFEVRQSRSGNGMTNLALRGSFASCASGPSARARAAYRKTQTQRKLWAKDRGGRFKTSGKGSVATVRGTSWYTADRCDGTITRVSHGRVLVRERGTGRRKLLTRGESFLARFPR